MYSYFIHFMIERKGKISYGSNIIEINQPIIRNQEQMHELEKRIAELFPDEVKIMIINYKLALDKGNSD